MTTHYCCSTQSGKAFNKTDSGCKKDTRDRSRGARRFRKSNRKVFIVLATGQGASTFRLPINGQ